jgi:hypothetical protein
LPRELRDIIYFYALASPTTRWTIRHEYDCKLRDRTAAIEDPPFIYCSWCAMLPTPPSKIHVCRRP